MTINDDATFIKRIAAGGIGCSCAGFLTNPLDVIKIKNQQYGGAKYGNLSGTARVLLNEEGLRGFYKGAATTVLRELTYSSLRFGLYEPIKSAASNWTGEPDDSPVVKWASSFTSGAIGAAIFNPVDLVKVRFQSQLPGQPKPYTSIINAFTTIYREERGLRGLYNGTSPTVVRAAFLTSAELGSYDVIKNNILVHELGLDHEALSTHFTAAFFSSLIATTAANPADVVKTRVFNDRSPGGPGGKALMHLRSIVRNEGLSALFKGWTPSYLRIGPHTIISFLLIEKIRPLLGLTTY